MNADVTCTSQDTPARVFRARCREWAGRDALRTKRRGLWQRVDWAGYYEQARAVGLALAARGLARGDVICVLAENRPEWLYVELGAQCMGLIGCGIHPAAAPAQVARVLQHSGARAVFVENQEQLDKVLQVRGQCPALCCIVVMERAGLRALDDAGVVFFDDFAAGGLQRAAQPAQARRFEEAIDAGRPCDTAFLAYTSGTAGEPRGAMVSCRNVVFQMGLAHGWLDVPAGARSLSLLSLCHIAERMASVYHPMAAGLVVHFPENAATVANDLCEVAPQVLFAPPRFWEQLASRVDLAMRDAIPLAAWVYRQARARGQEAVAVRLQGGNPAPPDAATGLLQWLAFRNVRIFLGLQHLRVALTGAAPVPPALVRWYLGCGIELREAFGMAETSGFATATPRGGMRAGRAGLPAPGTELRTGAQGEILVRGPHVVAGYWHDAAASREAIDAEGWLHTGDCGEIDASGCLAVRGRIEDVLVTSGGEHVAPGPIEMRLRQSPYVDDAVVVGDARPCLACLLVLDHEQVARYAQEQQIAYTDYASLARAPGVAALLRTEIERANAGLARAERVQDFRVIDVPLAPEDEELTPAMTLRRQVVAHKYAALIESMY